MLYTSRSCLSAAALLVVFLLSIVTLRSSASESGSSCEAAEVASDNGRRQTCGLDNPNADALGPGDLNKLFERITTDEKYAKYKPTALSRPGPTRGGGAPKDADDCLSGPWIVTLDGFLTPEECDRLIELGTERGYRRSMVSGEKKSDGTYAKEVDKGRTSTNAWCAGSCYKDPVTKGVMEKVAELTSIPATHSEYLQLVKYEVGEFYGKHHDYSDAHAKKEFGVRVLTLFLYLNDVEEGGETSFFNLERDLAVAPKRGKAVLWTNVLDSDPNKKDYRTNHEALPVKRGIKYGANAWIHMHRFKSADQKK